MGKFRHHKVKREHHVLSAIEADLYRIAEIPAVQSVIPGPIRPKAGRSTGFTLQYATPTGLKLIARSPGAAQEVFVVTANPEAVADALMASGLLARLPNPPPSPRSPRPPGPRQP
jgi:hypothetical protein